MVVYMPPKLHNTHRVLWTKRWNVFPQEKLNYAQDDAAGQAIATAHC